MASDLFTAEQEEIIRGNPIKSIDALRGSLPGYLSSFEQDIDEDTKSSLKTFLRHLSGTTAAELIKLADSPHNLEDELLSFTKAWSGTGKFSMNLRTQFSSLLETVASRASDLAIWTAVAKLLIASKPDTLPNAKKVSSHSSRKSAVFRDLQKDWKNDYFPDSLNALQSLIREYQTLALGDSYARTLVLVQSSGMGKSRLVDSFGQVCPMINFILREEEATGFPPADPEILSFLRKKPPPDKMNITPATSSSETSEFQERVAAVAWNHALAAALLQASFEIFNDWVKSQPYATSLKALANIRHAEMAPLDSGPNAHDDGGQRQTNRIKFCKAVAERALTIAKDLFSNENWVTKFKNEASSGVHYELESEEPSNPLNDLRTAVQKLIDNLQHESNDDPLLVIVFDEASSLIRKTAFEGLYVALNRIISCLKGYPLWSFFLSTESSIGQLVPPGNVERTGNHQVDPSARLALDLDVTKPPLKRFPPFVALQLDVEDRRRMQNSAGRDEELRKPLSDFAEPRHMTLFGRPLWYAYEKADDMNSVAKLKLLGGKQFSKFDHNNEDHVFAAMSFRLALDVCLQNPSSVSLAEAAVNSFMRVVISMDQDTGMMDTLTPSEPVLAKAAMEHLCYESNWTNSIRTLTQKLLEPGLIEKGHKGELYARLVLILAHDWVRWARQFQLKTSESVPKSAPEFQPTFTVLDFLTSLYGEDHHKHIQKIPDQILNATMNFTHFVPGYEALTPEVIPALCHDLLRRSAAMQLSFQQVALDLLLPIYYGKEKEDFNPSECGVILVQIKNKNKATTLEEIFKENFTKVSPKGQNSHTWEPANSIRKKDEFPFKQMANPILVLLFDLGVIRSDRATSELVQVSHSEISPDLWAIHSRGHDEAVFGCLKDMDTTKASRQFFVCMPKGDSLADELARRNRTFDKLQRSYRYIGFDSKQEVKIEADDGRAQEDDGRAQEDDGRAQEDDGRAQEDDGKAQEGDLKTLPFREPGSGQKPKKKKKKKKEKKPQTGK